MLHLSLIALAAVIATNGIAILVAELSRPDGKDGPALREAAPPRCGHNCFSSAAAFCLIGELGANAAQSAAGRRLLRPHPRHSAAICARCPS